MAAGAPGWTRHARPPWPGELLGVRGDGSTSRVTAIALPGRPARRAGPLCPGRAGRTAGDRAGWIAEPAPPGGLQRAIATSQPDTGPPPDVAKLAGSVGRGGLALGQLPSWAATVSYAGGPGPARRCRPRRRARSLRLADPLLQQGDPGARRG